MRDKRRIVKRLMLVTFALAGLVGGTTAYFSDTETSKDNILQAGAIDLKIDNESYYNGELWDGTTWGLANLDDGNGPASDGRYLFFDFHDLKPGDWGEDTISLHVSNNKYWSCMDVEITMDDDNGSVEPELSYGDSPDDLEDYMDGELADELHFVFWADDGDNVLEEHERQYIIAQGTAADVLGKSTWALADSNNNAWLHEPNSPLTGDDDYSNVYYVGKAWCFGDLILDPVADNEGVDPTVDGGVDCMGETATNMTQTDKLMADVSFRAVQYRHNGSFVCLGCEIIDNGWVDDWTSFDQGLRKDGSAVPGDRSDPTKALGLPDSQFVSLGYGGEIVLEFLGPVYGSEVSVIEVTYGRDTYPEESADVYVSANGSDWTDVGEVTNHDDSGVGTVDVTGISEIRYVKIVDTTDPSKHGSTSDGYDLDAVTAVVCWDDVTPAAVGATAN